MRRCYLIMSAMLIGSMLGGPAIAAEKATPAEKQQKIQAQKEARREAATAAPHDNQKPEKSGGLSIHPGGKKSQGSSSWFSGGGHREGGWSF